MKPNTSIHPDNKNWEYLLIEFKRVPTSEDLDKYGSEGWEMVCFNIVGSYYCWFKRQKNEN